MHINISPTNQHNRLKLYNISKPIVSAVIPTNPEDIPFGPFKDATRSTLIDIQQLIRCFFRRGNGGKMIVITVINDLKRDAIVPTNLPFSK